MSSKSIQRVSMNSKTIKRLSIWLLVIFGLSALLFILKPEVDIAVSSVFYRETDGFWLGQDDLLSAYRNIFIVVSIALAVLSFILWTISYWRGPIFGIGYRVWAFITLLYVLGPGLLVNGIFKSMFGRARPADVSDFGGDGLFTRAFEVADQCQSNCSFVSGEGSSATAFFISVFTLSFFVTNKTARYLIVALAFIAALIAATLRVMKGRHFISDTVFSVLIVSMVAALLSWFLLRRKEGS